MPYTVQTDQIQSTEPKIRLSHSTYKNYISVCVVHYAKIKVFRVFNLVKYFVWFTLLSIFVCVPGGREAAV